MVAVRNWEFFQPAGVTGIATGLGGGIDPFRLLKRRSSLVVADLPVSPLSVSQPVPAEMKSGGHLPKQQAPTAVFEEPDANSLLDSFGF